MQGTSNMKISAKFPQRAPGFLREGFAHILAASFFYGFCAYSSNDVSLGLPQTIFPLYEFSFGSPQSDIIECDFFLP